MPHSATAIAATPDFRTSLRSVSMPVSSSSIRMPICDRPSIMPFWVSSLGKRNVAPGPKPAEQRGTQDDPRQQCAHQRRLADTLHDFAQQPSRHQQQQDFRHQYGFALAAAAGAIAGRRAVLPVWSWIACGGPNCRALRCGHSWRGTRPWAERRQTKGAAPAQRSLDRVRKCMKNPPERLLFGNAQTGFVFGAACQRPAEAPSSPQCLARWAPISATERR